MSYYLAGPMSGKPQLNFPAFAAAARSLRTMGYDIVSPTELDGEPDLTAEIHNQAYCGYLKRDLALIAAPDVQGVVVLPGWKRSNGARTEVAVAVGLGKPVLLYSGSLPPVPLEVKIRFDSKWRLRRAAVRR